LLSSAILLSAGVTSAQLASSATHQLESYAIVAGATFSNTSTHQMWSSFGQSSPLGTSVTSVNASHRLQGGVIPTLYPRTRPGDVNGDGRTDAADVVTATRILNLVTPPPSNIFIFFNLDLNTDGALTPLDFDGVVDTILGR
jgi:hypothetical protein